MTGKANPRPNSRGEVAARIARLLDGEAPGTLVPSDIQLARKLKVSPATVNVAKRQMAENGLITKRATRYVTASPPEAR